MAALVTCTVGLLGVVVGTLLTHAQWLVGSSSSQFDPGREMGLLVVRATPPASYLSADRVEWLHLVQSGRTTTRPRCNDSIWLAAEELPAAEADLGPRRAVLLNQNFSERVRRPDRTSTLPG